jgi:hypothetical protein
VTVRYGVLVRALRDFAGAASRIASQHQQPPELERAAETVLASTPLELSRSRAVSPPKYFEAIFGNSDRVVTFRVFVMAQTEGKKSPALFTLGMTFVRRGTIAA